MQQHNALCEVAAFRTAFLQLQRCQGLATQCIISDGNSKEGNASHRRAVGLCGWSRSARWPSPWSWQWLSWASCGCAPGRAWDWRAGRAAAPLAERPGTACSGAAAPCAPWGPSRMPSLPRTSSGSSWTGSVWSGRAPPQTAPPCLPATACSLLNVLLWRPSLENGSETSDTVDLMFAQTSNGFTQ